LVGGGGPPPAPAPHGLPESNEPIAFSGWQAAGRTHASPSNLPPEWRRDATDATLQQVENRQQAASHGHQAEADHDDGEAEAAFVTGSPARKGARPQAGGKGDSPARREGGPMDAPTGGDDLGGLSLEGGPGAVYAGLSRWRDGFPGATLADEQSGCPSGTTPARQFHIFVVKLALAGRFREVRKLLR
jgi:hypothetical protein